MIQIGRLLSRNVSNYAKCISPSIIHARPLSYIKRIGVEDPRMSRIVVHNDVVYISGQTDATAKTIEGQTKNVLAKVDSLLNEAGTDKSKLLTSSIWLKDIE